MQVFGEKLHKMINILDIFYPKRTFYKISTLKMGLFHLDFHAFRGIIAMNILHGSGLRDVRHVFLFQFQPLIAPMTGSL